MISDLLSITTVASQGWLPFILLLVYKLNCDERSEFSAGGTALVSRLLKDALQTRCQSSRETKEILFVSFRYSQRAPSYWWLGQWKLKANYFTLLSKGFKAQEKVQKHLHSAFSFKRFSNVSTRQAVPNTSFVFKRTKMWTSCCIK